MYTVIFSSKIHTLVPYMDASCKMQTLVPYIDTNSKINTLPHIH